MATCRSSSNNIEKMNLKSVLNKNSPWAHTELEFDVLGVSRKLVKFVVHSCKKFLKKIFCSLEGFKLQNWFWVSRSFGG
jgi:hypothetical protein